MKNLIIIMVFLITSPAFAKQSVPVPQEALGLITALLHPGVQEQLKDFNSDLGYLDTAETVLAEPDDESQNTQYILKGMRLIGGDVVCGASELAITEKLSPNPEGGFGFVRSYEANVTKDGVCN